MRRRTPRPAGTAPRGEQATRAAPAGAENLAGGSHIYAAAAQQLASTTPSSTGSGRARAAPDRRGGGHFSCLVRQVLGRRIPATQSNVAGELQQNLHRACLFAQVLGVPHSPFSYSQPGPGRASPGGRTGNPPGPGRASPGGRIRDPATAGRDTRSADGGRATGARPRSGPTARAGWPPPHPAGQHDADRQAASRQRHVTAGWPDTFTARCRGEPLLPLEVLRRFHLVEVTDRHRGRGQSGREHRVVAVEARQRSPRNGLQVGLSEVSSTGLDRHPGPACSG